MSGVVIISVSLALFALAYIFYGGFVARRLGVDPNRLTPAHRRRDGVDYVPAKALFGSRETRPAAAEG